MAEGSGGRHPRRGVGYYNLSYPPPLVPYPPVPMATYQGPPQEMYMPSFQRGMQYTQYQDNTPYPGNSHFSAGARYEANTHYHGNNQYQGNVPFQDRTNMQYQSNCVMPSNTTTHVPFDNNYSNFNANHTPMSPSAEYCSEGSRQYSPGEQSSRHGFSVDASVNYLTVNPEQIGSSRAEVNGASVNGPTEEKAANVERDVEKIPRSSTNYFSNSAPVEDNSTSNNANENFVHGFYGDKVGQGNSSDGGVKSKGSTRGRGGQGRRGSRRGYGGDKSGQVYSNTQNSSNNYGRYDSRANNADERRRDRDTALVETAAFMKNLSIMKGGTGNVNPKEDNINNERRSRGGWGRQDRGGARGGGSRRQQRDYFGEEKQGKEWMNRQVRTDDEKGHSEVHNRYLEQNDIYDKPQRNDRSSNRGRGKWRNYGQDGGRTFENNERSWETNKVHDPDEGKAVNFRQTASVKPTRGGGRGRQDKRLWGNSDSSSSPSSDPGSRNAKKENQSAKEDSSTSSCSPVTGGNEDEETQRDRLMEQLMKGAYECMVCCDRIKQQHAIWSCVNCYNCFHLGCIKKWAKSSTGDTGWRCPACQGSTPKVPNAYRCFCAKMREPEWNRRDMAHSCGEICGRNRKIEWCKHKCNILCHPGPCPPCSAFIKRLCPCGAETREVKCSVTEPFICDGVCGKLLNCEGHTCEKSCHKGQCVDCEHQIQQRCHCGKESREVSCTKETFSITEYGCEEKCRRLLECGNHYCEVLCHPGDCQPCKRAVNTITRCPCGKVPLEKLYERDGAIQRKSCTDLIPTCSQPCQRILKCGVPGSYHECQALCHEGPCPSCPLETPVKCRCGAMDRNVLCSELTAKADEVTCKKPCKKMRHCSRHKCATRCCIDVDHLCTLVCGRMLSCGLHKCEEPCHRGNCPRCWQTSFEELTCHCGASVIYPPVPCGTKPPACENPCRRSQNCPHEASHLCHPDEPCPPCTMLVDKQCFGNHKLMRRTLCYLTAVSCGGVCGFPLPCGLHKCQRVCHERPCVPEGTLCIQKCLKPRDTCGHPCANPCHSGLCPDTSCKEMVKISCECGHRKATLQCSDNDREYRTLATSLLASQMQNMNNGCSVDLSDIFTATARPDKLKRLPCNEECQTAERNRRLALALQIENPEAREKLGHSNILYSDFMKDEARKDPNLAKMVHDALTDLVLKAKESKQKSCIHSFAPMNREKRQFVHEYCEHFGCQSQSYDEEPKKNIVATAVRGMCYLPPVSVLTLTLREQGQRKVPAPVWTLKPTVSDNRQGMQKLEKSNTKKESESTANKPPPIDYFDFDE
ncbi:protein shuttle craft-like [Homarus americanus]|uniref:Shuttle craft-like n=1 Tax=Homarus americanus TaxID=6706 RepID=A0A8J5ND04_HOMAM|nr:protein shuttle craft-like [Homarus americanus]XP_042223381.1 protein shuttle craft-like [Homarus americanus]KAG7176998.1 shuttle craft-like [Homarus americanus]